ncbi:nitrogenase-stabilizing/protective protein NifW [Teredinibacter turnerae]|uniref:nitrogenase-stabilizing/protective protein NifW n=1 Tax=Teredinibacter turnerae TaxID=2426 RepID=UPI00036C7842|nr:nitrogenase-stabilizing/protective protein NifW [Teredinibacter turnerae]
MTQFELDEDMDELSSAEDFLTYFEIEFDQKVVHVNRLHIMQRYHDYLDKAEDAVAEADTQDALKKVHKALLERAYQDFVDSDAATEKVFKVFKMQEPQTTFVSIDQLQG